MNIKDLAPGSYTVIEDKPLNINDLEPGSYKEVANPDDEFQERLKREQEEVAKLKKENEMSPLQSAVTGASTAGDFLGARYAAAVPEAVVNYMTGKYPELGEAYSKSLGRIDAVRDKAAEDNPVSYTAGAIGGGLAAGGPAVKAAKALGGGITGAVAAGAGEGALQGLGSSRGENANEIARDAALGAGLGGVIPAATGVLGKGVKAAPDLIPAAREGNTIGNRVAATVSPRRLLPGTTKQDILDYLSNPELRKKARATDVNNEISKLSSTLSDEMAGSKQAVSNIYGELEDQAVKEIGEVPKGVFDNALQAIKDNPKEVYGTKVRGAIKAAKELAEGQAGVTKNASPGERLLAARRMLDDGVGDRASLSRAENKLINDARGELQSVLRQSKPMAQADDLYSEFRSARKGLEDKIFTGRKGEKELSPEKLRQALTTTTLKGDAFEESLNTYNKLIESNPRLASSPEVTTAKKSLEKLKEVIDVGQLEYKLSRSGGPTAEAAFLMGQGILSSVAGPAAFIGLPVMNPTVWSALVDGLSPSAQALARNVEKAAPLVRSAAIRETVRQKNQPE